MPLVFVYGTLMRNDVRAGSLAGEQFVGAARTLPRYRLYNCGDYPALVDAVPVTSGRAIAGELYDVSAAALSVLDEVEGVAERLYARRRVLLESPHGDQEVEAYFYLLPIDGLPDCGERWGPCGKRIEDGLTE